MYQQPMREPLPCGIRGCVIDSKTEEPILNAKVHIIGSGAPPFTTGKDGLFVIMPIKPREGYEIKTTNTDYNDGIDNVTVNEDSMDVEGIFLMQEKDVFLVKKT